MRIVHLTPALGGHGGVQRVINEVIRRQVQRGHSVSVIAVGTPDRGERLSLDCGVSVTWFPTTRRISGRYSYQSGLARTVRELANSDALLHAHYPFATPTVLAALTSAPKVLTPYFHVPRSPTRLSEFRLRTQCRLLAARFRGHIAFLSESEREAFESLAGRHYQAARVIPPGFPEFRPDPQPFPVDKPVILAVARLVDYKRLDRLVEATASLRDTARLVIVGEGPARASLERRCADVGLDPGRVLIGAVDDTTLQRWYRTADVVVSLSEEESFGLTLLEAAAHGAAIVASDIPAHRDALEVIGSFTTCALVPGDDSQLTIAQILQSSIGRRRSSAGYAPPRTWSDFVDELDALYERALTQGKDRT
jgi:glycosyltransferase involved in cell wall biosynthesis